MEDRIDDVIILGAGFSYDANVPLLGNFVDVMMRYAYEGKVNGKEISGSDRAILQTAIDIKDELDGYHGRVRFSDRNIEEILSILSYNDIGDDRTTTDKREGFKSAISKVIELSCRVEDNGSLSSFDERGQTIYNKFWKAIFLSYQRTKKFPTIISFNYDLVLERSLLSTLLNPSIYSFKMLNTSVLRLNYYNHNIRDILYEKVKNPNQIDSRNNVTHLKQIEGFFRNNYPELELLKLHGSLNFPIEQSKDLSSFFDISKALLRPLIVPPVANKASVPELERAWRMALTRLSKAKNVTFVGYSLPETDLNVQYFFKAAFGPNKGLNKITVFDPVLWKNNDETERMKQRFKNCFSDEVYKRIEFNPKIPESKSRKRVLAVKPVDPGTTRYFIELVNSYPQNIFY